MYTEPSMFDKFKLLWADHGKRRTLIITLIAFVVILTFTILVLALFFAAKTSQETQTTTGTSSKGVSSKGKGSNGTSGGSTSTPGSSTDSTKKTTGASGSSSGSSSSGSSSGSSGSSGGDSGGGGSTPDPGTCDGTVASRACYPERFSVGAPGIVGHPYSQSDATLPVPSGYTEIFPSDNTSKEYDLFGCTGTTTLDHKYIHAFIYVGTGCHGTINITNSIIAPPPGSQQRAILVNADNSAPLTINISDTTIRPEPVGLGGTNAALTDHVLNDCETCTINMNRVDIGNAGGMCLCGRNTIVEHSWLHDTYIAHLSDPTVAHTGGVFPYGGSGPLTVRYNRMEPGVNAFTGTETPNAWKAITAPLFTQSSGGTVLRNYQAYGNFLSLGSINAYFQDGENMVFKNNVFGPFHFSNVGTCSPGGCTISFSDWSGNVTGDIAGNVVGTVVNPP